MANTSSAKKAVRQAARRTEVNKSRKSHMRNTVRKVEQAITSGDKSAAADALKAAEPALMRSAQLGVLHRNAAARKVSRLASRIKSLDA